VSIGFQLTKNSNNRFAWLVLFVLSFSIGVFFISKIKQTHIMTFKNEKPGYVIDLANFNIKNDGTSHKETSLGLNKALQYAKEQDFEKIIFPKGTYLIDEANPIILDFKNTIIDLNGSTLQINTNGLEKYSIVEFRESAENVRLTNGTIRGDKDTHDYLTIKAPHEWGCGVVFKSGVNLQMDNVTVINVTGYGVSTESGVTNDLNRFHTLNIKNTTQGSISDNGKTITSTTSTKTIKPYDVSVCDGEFELGYTLGYQGYPYLKNREYTSYFYDENMTFIQKKECVQFRKVDIPKGSRYVHFVFPQANITSDLGYYAWISNLKPPTNVILKDNLIKGNRSLGMAFTGGQQWTIENNVFEENGGNAPSYAVDFEDGWELMQDVVFKNNKFINNKNDLVVCAGDNLIFKGNEFQHLAYFWGRTTNYKFKNNIINSGSASFEVKNSSCEVSGNTYINSSVTTTPIQNSDFNYNLDNETFIDSGFTLAQGTKLINSTIKSTKKPMMVGSIENSTIEIAASESFDLNLKNCKIQNSNINLHKTQYFENCQITNSNFTTHSDTSKIHFRDSEFINSQMSYTTWGAAADITFEDCKATMDADRSLISLSAGKTRSLTFKNNIVINKSSKPVFDLYDAHYTVPNGNATIEGNSFTLTNYDYVFDGVNITQGSFNFLEKNNSIKGATMLSSKYTNNQHFNIQN
jgi:hypothetical protein